MISGKAVLLTGSLLHDIHAKTAHGLLRGGDRFEIVAAIDFLNAGKNVHDILDKNLKQVPILKNFKDFKDHKLSADYAIIGVATKGGVIPDSMRETIMEAIKMGMSIVNGLHEHLAEIDEIKTLAEKYDVKLYDIRKPKPFKDLRFWSGKIIEAKCAKIAVLGTDCALGKRTTARLLTEALKDQGKKAEMIYTGQTGWLQGGKYGFIFDATLNDFISGEIESSILECYKNENPEFIIIEGQSALRNPSGPCGSEFIVSGNLDGVILQHAPARAKYKDLNYHAYLPTLQNEIELIKMYGAPTLAICLNTTGLENEEAKEIAKNLESELSIPVIRPLDEGMARVIIELNKLSKS